MLKILLYLFGALSFGLPLFGCAERAGIQIESLTNSNSVRAELHSSSPVTNNLSVIPVTLKFSEDVDSDLFSSGMIQVSNGVASNFSGSGRNFSFDVVPTVSSGEDVAVTVTFPETELRLLSSGAMKRSNSSSLVFTVDMKKPTVQLTTTAPSPTNVAAIPVNVVFSEGVTGLSMSSFEVSGGGAAVTSLTGSGSSYVLSVTATFAGNINIKLPVGAVTDTAGNPSFASNELDVFYDNNIPLPVLASSAATTNNLSSIPVTVEFGSVSVFNLADSDFTVTNGTISGFTGSGSSYSLNLIPSGEGAVTIRLPAGAAENSLGTLNLASNTLTFNVDRVAPTLAIVGPTPALGNRVTNFVWTVNYTGAGAISLVSGNISLGGTATAGCTAVVSGSGTSSRTVTVSGCSGNGNLNISIPANSAQDAAGNQALAAGPSSDATVDNNGPSLAIAGPTPTIGKSTTSFVWTVNYTGASNVTLANGNISLGGTAVTGCSAVVSGSGTSSRTVTVTGCTGNGSLHISVAANSAQDSLGNQAPAEGPSSDATVDNTAPTLVIGSAAPSIGNSSATFSWPVTYTGADSVTLSSGMISLNGTATANCVVTVTGSGTTNRVVEINGCTATSGTLGFSIAANSAQDSVGNQALAAGPSGLVTIDNNNLTIGLSSTANPTTNLSSIPVTVVTSAPTGDFTVADLNFVNATAANFAGSGASYTFDLIPNGDGIVSVQVPAGAAHDSVPNANLASNILSFNVDRVAPMIAIAGPNPSSGKASTSFVWTVNYSGADSISLTSGNISLGGTATVGCSAVVTGTGTASRTVTVSGCGGNGSLNISVPANSAQDLAGNQSLAAGPSSDAAVDNTAPTLAITGPTPSIGNSAANFSWTVTYAGADAVTLAVTDISLGGTATVGCTKSVSGSGSTTRTVTISNCSGNGSLNISIAANSAHDSAGNQAVATGPSSDAIVDNTAPTLAISGPAPLMGNSSGSFVWTVTYAGADNVTLTDANVSLGGAATAGCTKIVSGSGVSSRTVTVTGCTGNGNLNISVAANSAHDNAGNEAAASSVSSNAAVDNAGPTLTFVGPTPALGKSSASFVWNLNYADASSVTVGAGDISLIGAGAVGCSVSLSGSGLLTRTVTVTNCTGNGTMGVSVAANTAQDALGNYSGSATSTLATVDNMAPSLTLTVSGATSGNSTTAFAWTVNYAGADTVTLASADVLLSGATGGCAKAITGSGTTTRTVTITGCTGNGNLSVSLAANTAQDSAGNQAAASSVSSVVVDNIGPTVTISTGTPAAGNNGTVFSWNVTYTDAYVVTLSASDILLSGTATANCTKTITGSGSTTRTVTISNCSGNGSLGFSLASNTAVDIVGNPASAVGPSPIVTVDNTPPSLAITSPASGSEIANTSSFTVNGTCSENGRNIVVTPTATTTCVSGVWTVTLDLSAETIDTVNFSATTSDVAGNTTNVSRTFIIPRYKVKEVFSNKKAFAALRSDGSVAAWGDVTTGGVAPTEITTSLSGNVKKIVSNDNAFAALRADGSVVSWGQAASGGGNAPPSVTNPNSNVIEIFSTSMAFAALKVDGSVVTWGDYAYGGSSSAPSSVTNAGSGVVKIFGNTSAFVALKGDGTAVAWGNASYGGSNSIPGTLTHVIDIVSTPVAFAALKSDGSVATWGDATYGGDSSAVSVGISSGVKKVFSNGMAFAALKSDGSVVGWGDSTNGGTPPSSVTTANSKVVKIFGNAGGAFAALKSNGAVIAWGNNSFGGNSMPSAAHLTSGVVDIASTYKAFAALKHDGSVITWGSVLTAPVEVTSPGSRVIGVFGNLDAFAALRYDGSVVTWGQTGYGGVDAAPLSVTTAQSKVIKIYKNDQAFAALRADGSVTAWGAYGLGGDGSGNKIDIAGTKVGVKEIVNTDSAFAALKSDGSVTAWGNTNYGGTIPVSNSNFKKIFSNGGAFVGLKSDGSLISWGSSAYGNTSLPSEVTSAGSGVVQVASTEGAFAALRADGKVYAWGNGSYGGYISGGFLPDIKSIVATSNAFAALRHDGGVVTWGNGIAGSPGASKLTELNSDVIQIYSTKQAFAALKSDGSVVTWGESGYGEAAPVTVTNANSGVVNIFSTSTAFVALKADGSLEAWGHTGQGGYLPTAITSGANNKFVDVASNQFAFTARKSDGSVYSWGVGGNGGAGPGGTLGNIKKVYSNYYAFVGVYSNGDVEAWGDYSYGGNESGASADHILNVVGNDGAFASIRANGTVTSWGDSGYGGYGAAPNSVTALQSGIIGICGNRDAFVALKVDGTLSAWGVSGNGGTTPAP